MSKTPQQNPVAASISAISSTQHETATSCGQRWGKLDKLERLESQPTTLAAWVHPQVSMYGRRIVSTG
jgi:hypothetical protein